MPDEAFVNKFTNFLKSENEKAELEKKRQVLEAEAIKAHAPEQWQQLRAWVKSLCEQVNRDSQSQAMTFRDTPNPQIVVDVKAGNHPRLIQANFHEGTNTISYDNARRNFSPFVDSQGFGFTDGNHRVSVEQMGQLLISSATDMR